MHWISTLHCITIHWSHRSHFLLAPINMLTILCAQIYAPVAMSLLFRRQREFRTDDQSSSFTSVSVVSSAGQSDHCFMQGALIQKSDGVWIQVEHLNPFATKNLCHESETLQTPNRRIPPSSCFHPALDILQYMAGDPEPIQELSGTYVSNGKPGPKQAAAMVLALAPLLVIALLLGQNLERRCLVAAAVSYL